MKLSKIIILVTVFLLTSSCLKKPGIPQWNSTYSFPILHDTLRVWDMLGDTNHIVVGPDSLLMFNVSSDIDTIYPAEDMKISNIDTSIRAGFGRLVVRNITSNGIRISWGDFPLPDSILDTINNHINDSIRIFLPTILPDTVTDTTDTLTKFDWAGINYASITVHFENNFPVTISPYEIWLYSLNDFGDTSLVFHGRVDSIGPYDIIDTTLTIDSIYTTNNLRFIEYMGVPGGDSVYVSARNNFFVQVTLDSIVVDSARAFFQGFDVSDTFNINPTFEQGQIDTVVLDSGHIYLDIYNPLLIDLYVNMMSNNILSGRTPFDTTIHILPDNTTSFSLDLGGRSIVFGDSGLTFIVSTSIDPQWIEIRKYDSVEVNLSSDTVSVNYFSGVFDSVESDIPEIDTTLDIPDTLNIHLTHVYLTGNIVQTLNFAPEANLTATVINVNGDTVSQTYQLQLRRGSPNNPSITPINLDIGNLFWSVPQEVRISGNVLIDGRGSAYRDDWVTGHVEITVPFSVVFSPDTVISDTSIDSLEVDSTLIDRFQSGTLFIRLRNRIPLGFSAKFNMISNWGDTLTESFTIPPAPHDVNGFATGEKDTTIAFTLTHDEAVTFEAPEQTSWIEIYIPQTDTVSIRASDYIKLDVMGKVTARMGE